MKRGTRVFGLLLLLMLLASCKQGTFYAALGDQIVVPLSIAPTAAHDCRPDQPDLQRHRRRSSVYLLGIIRAGNHQQLHRGFLCQRRRDRNHPRDRQEQEDKRCNADGDFPGLLALNPATATVNVNCTTSIRRHGGTPPYTFSMTATGSGSPTLTGSGSTRQGSLLPNRHGEVTDSAHAHTSTQTATVT